MNIFPIAEAFWQVTPGNARSIAVEDSLDEQPIVRRSDTNMALPARQQIANTLPLIVPKSIATHRSAPNMLTAYESNFAPRRNPLNDDTP